MADKAAGAGRQAVWNKAVNDIAEQHGAPKCSIINRSVIIKFKFIGMYLIKYIYEAIISDIFSYY